MLSSGLVSIKVNCSHNFIHNLTVDICLRRDNFITSHLIVISSTHTASKFLSQFFSASCAEGEDAYEGGPSVKGTFHLYKMFNFLVDRPKFKIFCAPLALGAYHTAAECLH